MKVLRIGFFAVLALTLMVVIGVGIFIATLDVNRYKPDYQVDISRLAADLAKSQLGDKAQQEVNKVIPGLGDALKGLFGH